MAKAKASDAAERANRFSKDAVIVAQNATLPAVQLACAIIASNPEHPTTTESALDLVETLQTAIFESSMRLGGVQSLEEFLGAMPVQTQTPPGEVKFQYGKHKGKTIAETFASEPDYLTWAVENLRNEYVVGRIRAYLTEQS